MAAWRQSARRRSTNIPITDAPLINAPIRITHAPIVNAPMNCQGNWQSTTARYGDTHRASTPRMSSGNGAEPRFVVSKHTSTVFCVAQCCFESVS